MYIVTTTAGLMVAVFFYEVDLKAFKAGTGLQHFDRFYNVTERKTDYDLKDRLQERVI